ncbi:hypothetical protein Q839_14335 [Listeria monocytogenes]|nr:hypothetical protein [Listeria monocytogenes]
MFLMEKKISILFVFVSAYIAGRGDYDPSVKELFNDFYLFTINKYRMNSSSMGWLGVINGKTTNEDDAFHLFYELFDEFLIETTGKNLEENVNLE